MKKKFVKPEIKSIRLRLRENILAGSGGGRPIECTLNCKSVAMCKAGFEANC